jgi:hypothetical protein
LDENAWVYIVGENLLAKILAEAALSGEVARRKSWTEILAKEC